MKYQDLIYGQFEISEPVILELINSPWLERLKGVDQGGYAPLLTKPTAKLMTSEHNRFAHSLGVYLLLNKFGVPIEEQIAGLIHDVSHSVFSHCIDYALEQGNGKEQNHQDNFHDSYIKKTKIPDILKKYNFDLDYILNDKNFPLKENNIPDLCADRIDYSLREGVISKKISRFEAEELINGLITENGNWIFNNFKTAQKFAKLFLTLNRFYFADLPTAIMFLAVGDYLGYSLKKKYIGHDDLYATDKMVIEKINQYLDRDEKLKLLWRRMNDKNCVSQNQKNYDAEIFCKSRIVDPLFKDGGKIKRLSKAEPSWAEIVKRELKPKQYFLKYNY